MNETLAKTEAPTQNDLNKRKVDIVNVIGGIGLILFGVFTLLGGKAYPAPDVISSVADSIRKSISK